MLAADACIGFEIGCETLVKGGLAVAMAFVLFVGSILLLLSAVFGRRMGYLVLAVAFFGWMAILSSLWTFGYWSQGPDTPVNLGPRGEDATWVVEAAGTQPEPVKHEAYASYPSGGAWRVPGTNDNDTASVQSVTSAAQAFLAHRANEDLGLEIHDPGAVQTTEFVVQDVRFGTEDETSLAGARAYFSGGGPVITLYMRHDSGSVNRYSWMLLIGSLIGLAAHLPLLDRAERKRKDILTGGAAPPWFGPA